MNHPDTMLRVWLRSTKQVGPNLYECRWVSSPVDELDVEYDGYPLRSLLSFDSGARRENVIAQTVRQCMTPHQRAAIAAHWSAELRDRLATSEAIDAARKPSVLVDLEDA